MLNKKAYLFGDMIELDKDVVLDVISDIMEDFFEHEKEAKVEIPKIIKGQFSGYVNKDGWPIGTFYAYDGRVFIAEMEQVTEITLSATRYTNELRLVSVN